jgi:hypothetical protein
MDSQGLNSRQGNNLAVKINQARVVNDPPKDCGGAVLRFVWHFTNSNFRPILRFVWHFMFSAAATFSGSFGNLAKVTRSELSGSFGKN